MDCNGSARDIYYRHLNFRRIPGLGGFLHAGVSGLIVQAT